MIKAKLQKDLVNSVGGMKWNRARKVEDGSGAVSVVLVNPNLS